MGFSFGLPEGLNTLGARYQYTATTINCNLIKMPFAVPRLPVGVWGGLARHRRQKTPSPPQIPRQPSPRRLPKRPSSPERKSGPQGAARRSSVVFGFDQSPSGSADAGDRNRGSPEAMAADGMSRWRLAAEKKRAAREGPPQEAVLFFVAIRPRPVSAGCNRCRADRARPNRTATPRRGSEPVSSTCLTTPTHYPSS